MIKTIGELLAALYKLDNDLDKLEIINGVKSFPPYDEQIDGKLSGIAENTILTQRINLFITSTCIKLSVNEQMVRSTLRERGICAIRDTMCYLIQQSYPGFTLKSIGGLFSNRDHSTIGTAITRTKFRLNLPKEYPEYTEYLATMSEIFDRIPKLIKLLNYYKEGVNENGELRMENEELKMENGMLGIENYKIENYKGEEYAGDQFSEEVCNPCENGTKTADSASNKENSFENRRQAHYVHGSEEQKPGDVVTC
jgi:hypothetical protein